MTITHALILGILQGVAEFLPISSSGHLLLARNLLGLSDVPILFDILLHVATLFVVVLVFRHKIGHLFVSLGRFIIRKNDDSDKVNLKTIVIVFIATFITAFVGLGISKMEIGPQYVSLLLTLTGVILIVAKFFPGKRNYNEIRYTDGIITGFAQGLGVLPGISRSGITISAAGVGGLNSSTAGEFSFIISIPAILGALILDLKDAGDMMSFVSWPVLLVAILTTAIVGFLSLKLLLKLLKSGKLYFFSFYLIPVGLLGFFYFM